MQIAVLQEAKALLPYMQEVFYMPLFHSFHRQTLYLYLQLFLHLLLHLLKLFYH